MLKLLLLQDQGNQIRVGLAIKLSKVIQSAAEMHLTPTTPSKYC
jgi:hypothetical protein